MIDLEVSSPSGRVDDRMSPGRPAADYLRQTLRLTWFYLVQKRLYSTVWIAGLLLLVGVTAPSYQDYYPDSRERAVLVEQMQDNPGTRLLYGNLPSPGTLGQFFAWETGTFVLILIAVMMILLAVSLTKADEDRGNTEVIRTVGVGRSTPLLAHFLVLFIISAILALGTYGLLALQADLIDEMTFEGAAVFGWLVLVACLYFSAVAIVVAQVFSSHGQVIQWSFLIVAIGFAGRVVSDYSTYNQNHEWLQVLDWISPFGWRNVTSPYTDDELWTIPLLLLIAVALVALSFVLLHAREHRSSLIHRTGSSDARLQVHGMTQWVLWRNRTDLLVWAVGILVVSVIVGLSTESLVTAIAEDEATAALLADLTGQERSEVDQYFSFLGLVLTVAVGVFGIGAVLRWSADERSGRVTMELSVGQERVNVFLSRVIYAVLATTLLLLIAGLPMGLLGESQLSGDIDRGEALRSGLYSTVGHLPGVFVLICVAALLVGLSPRIGALAWLLLAWSAFSEIFGDLVDLSEETTRFGALAWAPRQWDQENDLWVDLDEVSFPVMVWMALLGLGLVLLFVAHRSIQRRDIQQD